MHGEQLSPRIGPVLCMLAYIMGLLQGNNAYWRRSCREWPHLSGFGRVHHDLSLDGAFAYLLTDLESSLRCAPRPSNGIASAPEGSGRASGSSGEPAAARVPAKGAPQRSPRGAAEGATGSLGNVGQEEARPDITLQVGHLRHNYALMHEETPGGGCSVPGTTSKGSRPQRSTVTVSPRLVLHCSLRS